MSGFSPRGTAETQTWRTAVRVVRPLSIDLRTETALRVDVLVTIIGNCITEERHFVTYSEQVRRLVLYLNLAELYLIA
jgi:hypothetical protein